MSRIYRSEAIILRNRHFLESSKITTLYTLKMGKVEVVAKGSRRPGSQFGASLDTATHCSAVFYHRPERDLHTLSQCDILNPFPELHDNLSRMAYAASCLQFVDLTTPLEEPHDKLFHLILMLLRTLEAVEYDTSCRPLLWAFLLRASGLSGWAIVLDRCLLCNEEAPIAGISASLGGTICTNCRDSTDDLVACSPGTVKLLQWLSTARWERMARLSVDPTVEDQAQAIIRQHINRHTERDLTSLDFLAYV